MTATDDDEDEATEEQKWLFLPDHRRAGVLGPWGCQTARRAADTVPDCGGSEPCPDRCRTHWCRLCHWWEGKDLKHKLWLITNWWVTPVNSRRLRLKGLIGWSISGASPSPVSMDSVVVFPAPLCPSSTVICPSNMFRVRSRTALRVLLPTLNSCQ